MNKSILHSAIAAAMSISIAACSSGGSDVAGIGGSGITPTGGVISSGTITGFGSIFVNGVEFETSSSNFSIDDNPGTESDLAIGMRVIVDGTVNADGVSGTATSVSFDDQLQGPVGTVSAIDADGTGRTITVLGTTVALNSTSTIFDVSGTGGGNFSFDNISTGDNVEVSAFPDSTGVLKATRVELKDQNFTIDSSIVELKGTVTGPVGTTFNLQGIAGITVDASTAAIDDLPGGLVEGAPVEVKGTCPDLACATIEATRVEGQTSGFDDNDKVELEGLITRYVSDSDFDVNGFPVNASNAVKTPTALTLAVDKEVEVEGNVVNGVLVASKIKDEGGEIKIAATVAAGTVDSSTGSFDLEPVPGQTITVKIDTSTQIEDDFGTITNSTTLFTNLNDGDYVVVEGYDDGTGTVIAGEVERESADDVILQGKLEEIVQDVSVTVLGVTFDIQDDPTNSGNDETDFEDAADQEITQAAFITAAPDGTLIKIKDKDDGGTNGIADEVEIELP